MIPVVNTLIPSHSVMTCVLISPGSPVVWLYGGWALQSCLHMLMIPFVHILITLHARVSVTRMCLTRVAGCCFVISTSVRGRILGRISSQ